MVDQIGDSSISPQDREVYKQDFGRAVDLFQQSLEAYEIKFSSSPKPGMARSLAEFGKEFNVTKSAVLNLRRDSLPFSNNIIAEHWYSPI